MQRLRRAGAHLSELLWGREGEKHHEIQLLSVKLGAGGAGNTAENESLKEGADRAKAGFTINSTALPSAFSPPHSLHHWPAPPL